MSNTDALHAYLYFFVHIYREMLFGILNSMETNPLVTEGQLCVPIPLPEIDK